LIFHEIGRTLQRNRRTCPVPPGNQLDPDLSQALDESLDCL
jgi:hypothetical protein